MWHSHTSLVIPSFNPWCGFGARSHSRTGKMSAVRLVPRPAINPKARSCRSGCCTVTGIPKDVPNVPKGALVLEHGGLSPAKERARAIKIARIMERDAFF